MDEETRATLIDVIAGDLWTRDWYAREMDKYEREHKTHGIGWHKLGGCMQECAAAAWARAETAALMAGESADGLIKAANRLNRDKRRAAA